MTNLSIEELQKVANRVRISCIKIIEKAGSGHPGGSLSCVDIVTSLFFNQLHRTIKNALAPDRHKLVLSKGHGVPVLYSIFSEIGLIKPSELDSFRKLNSRLQGHPDYVRLPFVEASTGSLGQGLSIAQGLAIAAKMDYPNSRIYCIVGDGEMQEGQIWEALMSAPKMKLNNLCVILDYNKSQIDGFIDQVMPIEPIQQKLEAFNWNVMEVDGHEFTQLLNAFEQASKVNDKPSFIIAHTIKGKGVSFMEDSVDWHGKAPNSEEATLAIAEIASQQS